MRGTRLLQAALLPLFVSSIAQAANVSSTRDTTSSESWSSAAIWSNSTAPSAGNDYTTSHVLRTSSGEFAGDSLTFNGGTLATKFASQTESNLTMNNGSSIQNFHADSTNDSVGGNLTAHGAVTIGASGSGRSVTIAAGITGDATFNINNTSTNGMVTISSTGNAGFTGSWKITAGTLKATAASSLGTFGSINMTGGGFDADYDVNNPTGAMTLTGGAMTLDQNFTLGALTINGTPLSAGTYDFDTLNNTYDNRFVDGGTGSITVVPEPASASLMLLATAGLLRRRRRQ